MVNLEKMKMMMDMRTTQTNVNIAYYDLESLSAGASPSRPGCSASQRIDKY
jgi:hypothetical protein